jgi:kynurenine 3-monooxygenase
LLEAVLEQTLPMHGRMIHIRNASGKLVDESQAYDVHGRFQRSVDRGMLNKTILNMLDNLPNVKLCFQHKLSGADFRQKKAWFEILNTKSASAPGRPREIEITFDLMIGADGAHSATRQNLMKYARMEYTQTYIDCLWCEFTMPKSGSGDFQISPNHLHIWPGGSFMFIALPNVDKSFTCTFFGPVDLFKRLESGNKEDLVAFFDKSLPGVTSHIEPQDLFDQFNRNPHLPLINLKCTPHHFEDSGVIVGDAANAMVPFYGQGMNAGLESVRVLFERLDSSSSVLDALQSYTDFRTQDTYAITDLALANYVEMRASVVSPTYKLRKFIEERLDKYFPKLGWATQYSRVSFSNMRYSEIIQRAKYQKRVLTLVLVLFGALNTAGTAWVVARALRNRRARIR